MFHAKIGLGWLKNPIVVAIYLFLNLVVWDLRLLYLLPDGNKNGGWLGSLMINDAFLKQGFTLMLLVAVLVMDWAEPPTLFSLLDSCALEFVCQAIIQTVRILSAVVY